MEGTIRHRAGLLSRRENTLALASAGLWECRLRDEALEWTGGVYDLFDMPRGARLHRPQILDFYEPASRRLLAAIRARALTTSGEFRLDTEIVTARGRRRWIRIIGSVEMEGASPVRIFGMKQDVTEDIARLADFNRQAKRDPMTGLFNRAAFDERFTKIGGCDPVSALMLVDLDGFKNINDTYGHAIGDVCLKRSAARLAQLCPDVALVARIGGDEFAVLIDRHTAKREMRTLGQQIVVALGCPIEHGGLHLRIGASIGIAFAKTGFDCDSPAELFARADAALYAAKAAGRNTVRINGEQPLSAACIS